MSSHHIKKQLRNLRAVTPSASWQSAHRELLLSQIRSQVVEVPFTPSWSGRLRAWLSAFEAGLAGTISMNATRSTTIALLAVVILLGSGGYLVAAADQSVPGDRLYAMKIAVENTRSALARDPKERVKLQVEFAARRLDELSILARRGNTEPRLASLVTAFESNVTKASTTVAELSSNDSSDRVDAARLVDDKIAEYQHLLRVTGSQVKDRDVSARVDKALAAVNKAGTQALKVIIDSDGVSKDDLAQKIDNKIKQVEDSLHIADGKLSGGAKDAAVSKAMGQSSAAKENLAEAKQKVIEGDYKAALSILENVQDIVESVTDSADQASSTATPGEVKGEATPSDQGQGTTEPSSPVAPQNQESGSKQESTKTKF